MAAKRKDRILVIEDDPEVARLQQRSLEQAGFDVLTAHTASGGMRRVRLGGIDLLLLDHQLPDLDGLEVHEQLKNAGQCVPVILLSSSGEEAVAVKALRAGVRDFITRSGEYLKFLPEAIERVLNQVRLERQLADSDARLAGIINSAMDAILTLDSDRCITLFNPAAEKMFGCPSSEAVGQAIDQFIPAASASESSLSMRSDPQSRLELFGVRAGGEQFPLEVSISTAELDRSSFAILIARDVTEKKKVEAQFLRAQRMEGISSLAGGIAHDLNNVLTPLVMGIELLESMVPEDIRESLLEHMKRSTERGADMVKQILAVARNVEGKSSQIQLKCVVTDLVGMLKRTLPKSILLQTSFPEGLWPVVGDVGEITQVVLNLCLHARDAMPVGGKLSLHAANMVLDEHDVHGQAHARPGRYVRLAVVHSGPGLSAERTAISDRASVPDQPEDAGLTLSTAVGLVQAQGGFVDVGGETGKSAVFHVYLPAAPVPHAGDTETLNSAPDGSGELILIVDDETSIGEITKTILEAHGYRALTASSGAQGVQLYAKHREEVRAVLVDMIMPVMNGPATMQALRELNPRVPIIAMSGLAANHQADETAKLGVQAFLPKPYSKEILLASLHELLEGPLVNHRTLVPA